MLKRTDCFVYFIAVIAGLGGLLFGFDAGIIADAQWQVTKVLSLTHFEWSSVVSATVLGAFFGAIFSGQLVDVFGRKRILQITACNFIMGTFISAFAVDFYGLFMGRLILGLSIGIASFASPLFISEIAPVNKRGMLVLFNSVAITGGEAIAFLAGYFLYDVGEESFRLMFLLGVIPAILLLLGLCFVPCSPRWVASKKGYDEALGILKKIRGNNQKEINKELDEIKQTLNYGVGNKFKLLFVKPYRKLLFIGCALGILQQLAGINIIMYYGPFVLHQVGFSQSVSLFSTFIIGVVNTLFTLLALLVIDRLGRRMLLIGGAFVAGVSLLGVAIQALNPAIPPVFSLFFLMSYTMAFAMSLGCIFWLMISELYPLCIRGLAMSFATAAQWFANFCVTLFFLPLYHYLGSGKTLLLYCIACFVAVLFGIYYLPETKGVSLERIEENLRRGMPLRMLGS